MRKLLKAVLRELDAADIYGLRTPYVQVGPHDVHLPGARVPVWGGRIGRVRLRGDDGTTQAELSAILQFAREVRATYKQLRPYLRVLAHRPHQVGPLVVRLGCEHYRQEAYGVHDEAAYRAQCWWAFSFQQPLAAMIGELATAIRNATAELIAGLRDELAREADAAEQLERLAAPRALEDVWRERTRAALATLREVGVKNADTPLICAYPGDPPWYFLPFDGLSVCNPFSECVSRAKLLEVWKELEALEEMASAIGWAVQTLRPWERGQRVIGPVSLDFRWWNPQSAILLSRPAHECAAEVCDQIRTEVAAYILAIGGAHA